MNFEQWEERYRTGPRDSIREPNAFLKENVHLLPSGRVLDIAMGEGRNAIFLARRGFAVTGIDRSPTAVTRAREHAAASGVALTAEVADLESCTLPAGTFDVVVVLHYLQRSLFTPIVTALRAGGLLIYETFTVGQQKYRFHNPSHLLEPDELLNSFRSLDILRYREIDMPESRKCVASLLARKPCGSPDTPPPSLIRHQIYFSGAIVGLGAPGRFTQWVR